jgi:UDP-2,3-diacylglucosamine hydrolase
VTRALFISDLHLSEERPATREQFFRFLRDEARGAGALYVLGDLFEYWLGDDALAEPLNASVARALREVSAAGTPVFVMRGNRDFLIGRGFCEAAGAALLDDPRVVRFGGRPLLLLHGDTLCTDDIDYQEWRRTARSAQWRRDFLAKPLAERREVIEGLREKSKRLIRAKPADIMDVNSGAVRDAFRRHRVCWMIHGHTHRPALHRHEVDGQSCERWVLPDWYGAGGYLHVGKSDIRLIRF